MYTINNTGGGIRIQGYTVLMELFLAVFSILVFFYFSICICILILNVEKIPELV